MEEQRDEWKEEDGQLYVKTEDLDNMGEKLNETDQKANALFKLLNEHKAEVSNTQTINSSKLEELFKKFGDQQLIIKMNENTMNSNKSAIEQMLKDNEKIFT